MTEQAKTLDVLLPELQKAKQDLDARIEEEQAASRRTTDARNVYNGMCRRFDAAVAELKKDAPRNTDWSEGIRKGGVA